MSSRKKKTLVADASQRSLSSFFGRKDASLNASAEPLPEKLPKCSEAAKDHPDGVQAQDSDEDGPVQKRRRTSRRVVEDDDEDDEVNTAKTVVVASRKRLTPEVKASAPTAVEPEPMDIADDTPGKITGNEKDDSEVKDTECADEKVDTKAVTPEENAIEESEKAKVEPVVEEKPEEMKTESPAKSVQDTNKSAPAAKDLEAEKGTLHEKGSSPNEKGSSPNEKGSSPNEKGSSPDEKGYTTELVEGHIGKVTKKTSKAPPKIKGQREINKHNSDPLLWSYNPLEPSTERKAWKAGGDTPYAHLAEAFEEIENTSLRLRSTAILANCFRTIIALSPADLVTAVYLSAAKVGPAHSGLELGIGDSILQKAVAEATGRPLAAIRGDYDEMGDLGCVAEASRSAQKVLFKPAPLTLKKVFNALVTVAKESGSQSQDKKKDKIKSLLVASQGSESKYIVRSFQGRIRIGAAESTVLDALATACILTPPGKPVPAVKDLAKAKEELTEKAANAAQTLRSVYSECPVYDELIATILNHGFDQLQERCFLRPGVPVKPMLAHPTKGVQDVLDRFSNVEFTCEFKYDGERAQVHRLEDGSIKIFSRNSEDLTTKYPDIIAALPNAIKEGTKSFVLDSECVAYDTENEKILPFQTLSHRQRKNANVEDIKIRVALFAFDMLYINGRSLLREPLSLRREKMHESLQEVKGELLFAKGKDARDPQMIDQFLQDAIDGCCEGLMIKTTVDEATYEPAKRSNKWLKVKKDYIDGMTDSVDLVPIGAYNGKGKRSGVYGAYLLACYERDSEEYQSICKIGTGFSDAVLASHTEFLKKHIIDQPRSYYRYSRDLEPDVWFEPSVVWEVKAADLSVSPVHKAAEGKVDASKGIGLRFPRFLRIRDDKGCEDATDADQIVTMYNAQSVVNNDNAPAAASDAEDEW